MAEDKKILENEKLEMEDLDNVAGGYKEEILDDFHHFKTIGVLSHYNSSEDNKFVKEAWAAYGITAYLNKDHHNVYEINGREVSFEKAWDTVMGQVKNGYTPKIN